MKNTIKKQGFTLPEVVITSVILLVLIIPITRMAYTTVLQTRFARDMGTAVSVGHEQLETFSTNAYAAITSGSTTNGNMTLTWTVTEQNFAKIVDLTISWDTVGKARNVNFNAAYIADIDGGFSL